MIQKTEIVCFLADKSKRLFVAILDEPLGLIQYRTIEPIFGFPIDHLDDGCIFILKTEVEPGKMTYSTDEADIPTYIRIVNNEKIMSNLKLPDVFVKNTNKNYETETKNIENLYIRAQQLRENKIDKIIE